MSTPTALPNGVAPRRPLTGDRAKVEALAGLIGERAWESKGVRVYVLPCRSVLVTRLESRVDALMLRKHERHLVATWCRDTHGRGPSYSAVLAELRNALRAGGAQ